MSSAATAWAWQQQAGKNKMLLLALADLADDRGCTRTPIDTLAEMIDRDPRTVIRQLQDLVQAGLIERENDRAVNGIQLISRTRLQMGARVSMASPQPEVDTLTNCHPAEAKAPKSAISTPCQNVTRQDEAPEEAGCQNVTHKDKNPYSLLVVKSLTTNNNNTPPPAALMVLVDAGLKELWKDWITLNRLAPVTQKAQIGQWAAWVAEGRAEELKTEAQSVIEAGSYAHPWGGLKARMAKLAAEHASRSAAGKQVQAAFGEPQVRPGERRQAPDGRIWTVEAVEYGLVYFAEAHAPLDMGDALVARWPVVEGEGEQA